MIEQLFGGALGGRWPTSEWRQEDYARQAYFNVLYAQSQANAYPFVKRIEPTLFQEIEDLRVILKKLRFEILWDLDKEIKRLENLAI